MARYRYKHDTGELILTYFPEMRKEFPVPVVGSRIDPYRRRLTQADYRSFGFSLRDLEFMFDKLGNKGQAMLCFGLSGILSRPTQGLRSFLLYTGHPCHTG